MRMPHVVFYEPIHMCRFSCCKKLVEREARSHIVEHRHGDGGTNGRSNNRVGNIALQRFVAIHADNNRIGAIIVEIEKAWLGGQTCSVCEGYQKTHTVK